MSWGLKVIVPFVRLQTISSRVLRPCGHGVWNKGIKKKEIYDEEFDPGSG